MRDSKSVYGNPIRVLTTLNEDIWLVRNLIALIDLVKDAHVNFKVFER